MKYFIPSLALISAVSCATRLICYPEVNFGGEPIKHEIKSMDERWKPEYCRSMKWESENRFGNIDYHIQAISHGKAKSNLEVCGSKKCLTWLTLGRKYPNDLQNDVGDITYIRKYLG